MLERLIARLRYRDAMPRTTTLDQEVAALPDVPQTMIPAGTDPIGAQGDAGSAEATHGKHPELGEAAAYRADAVKRAGEEEGTQP